MLVILDGISKVVNPCLANCITRLSSCLIFYRGLNAEIEFEADSIYCFACCADNLIFKAVAEEECPVSFTVAGEENLAGKKKFYCQDGRRQEIKKRD